MSVVYSHPVKMMNLFNVFKKVFFVLIYSSHYLLLATVSLYDAHDCRITVTVPLTCLSILNSSCSSS